MFLGMSPARFLREHWQKRPLLVRGALSGFADPLSPEELAGLACEDGVESRLVAKTRGRWRVTWGPHAPEDFEAMPARGWTVLVQEVNRWVPDVAAMLEPFAFVPNVRVDDVMISYAAPGGGVGAHLDSYDVFLVQGLGQRRWRWHTKPTKARAFVPGLDLRILRAFEPDEDEVLEAGDLLYLPPGFAHEGTAVTPCLTYSVGFRAMSLGEAWTSFARFAGEKASAELLRDPPLAPAENPGAIPPAMLREARRAIRRMDRGDDAIDRWFASFSTRLKPGHALTPPRRPPADVPGRIARGDAVLRTEEGRWAFLPRGAALLLYVGGEEIAVPPAAAELARVLCASRRPRLTLRNAAERALVTDLFARGALRFAR